MYIPPGFTVITCEPVDEEAFRAWVADNGGVWHPAAEGHHGSRRAYAGWEFRLYEEMTAKGKTLAEDYKAKWIPRERMHKPPQSLVDVELSGGLDERDVQCDSVLHSLFNQWDSYAYDLGVHEWVSALLRDILPTGRIIQYEPPPPGSPTPWIWVNGEYTKNEAYYDNLDAAAATHENQLRRISGVDER